MKHPLRYFNYRWQVHLDTGGWVTCRSKHDAEILSGGRQLAMEAMSSRREDGTFIAQLIEMGRMLEKYDRKSDADFFYKSASRLTDSAHVANSVFDTSLQFPTYVLVDVGDHVVDCVMDLSSKPSLYPLVRSLEGDRGRYLIWFTEIHHAETYRSKFAPRTKPVPVRNAFQALALLGNQHCDGVVVDSGDARSAHSVFSLVDFCAWVRQCSGIASENGVIEVGGEP